MRFITEKIEKLRCSQVWVFAETTKMFTAGTHLPFDDTYKTNGKWTIEGILRYIEHAAQILDSDEIYRFKISATTCLYTMIKIENYYDEKYERSKQF